MYESSNAGSLDQSSGPAVTSGGGADTPLAEFQWSDRVVGLGYFPDEVGLPQAWTWGAERIAR